MNDRLAEVHQEIDAIDIKLIRLLADRHAVVNRVTEIKNISGIATFDLAREKEVIARAVETARECGLPAQIALEVICTIIELSTAHQLVKAGRPGVVVSDHTFCPACKKGTEGIRGPQGSTRMICDTPGCGRPLTSLMPSP